MFWRRQQQSTPSTPSSSTYVSAQSEFQGSLNTGDDLRVDGIIHGSVEVLGDMEVSESGLIEGPEIRARNLTIHGVVKARISVEGCLTLSQTARLEGDINASAVSIEEGAYYMGHITISDAKALPGMPSLQEFVPNGQDYHAQDYHAQNYHAQDYEYVPESPESPTNTYEAGH